MQRMTMFLPLVLQQIQKINNSNNATPLDIQLLIHQADGSPTVRQLDSVDVSQLGPSLGMP